MDQLKEAEETGIGYQVVGIKLKDGRSFDQVAVSDGCFIEVRGCRNIPFPPEEVASLAITRIGISEIGQMHSRVEVGMQ